MDEQTQEVYEEIVNGSDEVYPQDVYEITLDEVYEAGVTEDTVTEEETTQDTYEMLEQISQQVETTNYILTGMCYFIGFVVGLVFIKSLWDRLFK